MKTFWLAIIAVFAAITIGLSDAEARRMGGGASMGKQAPVQRQATPPQQQAPAAAPQQAQTPQAAAARPGQAAPAAAGNRWMGPLAGIAAGLGLAALASYLGFGEGLATIMLMVLLAVVAFVVIRMVMSRRAGGQPQHAYAGAQHRAGASEFRGVNELPASRPAPAYPAAQAAPVVAAPMADAPAAEDVQVPAGFDTPGFLHNAKVYFVRLQAAFDAGNTQDLREFTSPEMFAELKLQIDARKGELTHTDVVTLDAVLAGFNQDDHDYLVSVQFSGLIRETADPQAKQFDEVWNFAKPVAGNAGWVLAGIQQLDAN
jgi:predicted lipid-binding transport protein (Tim44 family)